MLKKLLLAPVYLVLLITDTLIMILHSDSTRMLVVSGSCLALLSLATGNQPWLTYQLFS